MIWTLWAAAARRKARDTAMPGLIIAAPASGSGKTTITLGLLRALRNQGLKLRGAKSGPDYIDPKFHEAATGQPCVNLDAWAMSPARIASLAGGDGTLIIEGAMGLFDGARPAGKGSVADLARQLSLPVVLVVDAARMAQSVAPLVAGFIHHDPQVKVVGVILNKIGSPRHEAMLRAALAPLSIPVLGAVPRDIDLVLPSRHLGLVQANEHVDLDRFMERAAALMAAHLDLAQIVALAQGGPQASPGPRLPLGHYKSIAIARDTAFSFIYPHLLAGWHEVGVQLKFFSPLADDPVPEADLIYLPGGYPELFAEEIAGSSYFLKSLKNASENTDIYGECGGYMVLGTSLTDAEGIHHKMAGLLGLHTSFEDRKLHLGYRDLEASAGPLAGRFKAHEFHYASTVEASGTPLFSAKNAEGVALKPMGLIEGRVAGSFAHIIDAA